LHWSGSEEAIYLSHEVILKRILTINDHDQRRGATMLPFIFDSLCHPFIRCPLSAMRGLGAG
jgi:hypothetical protein